MKWKLGNIADIGVYIHWTFWLLPAWIVLSGAGGGLAAAISSVLFIFAVFGCVVLHEVGHALMARHYGIGTRDITLYPIGGVASLERMPTKPSQELAIALAGPAVNVVIAAALFVGLLLTGFVTPGLTVDLVGGSFLLNLMAANVALVVFNMLPAFPMDGGRVLRSLLAMRWPRLKATHVAARVGQAVAVMLGMIGLFTTPTLVLVAAFVFFAAQAELVMARNEAAFSAPRQPLWSESPTIIWLDSDSHPSGPVRFVVTDRVRWP